MIDISGTLAQLLAETTAALDGLGVTVTSDAHEAAAAVAAGDTACLILAAPVIEWTTTTIAELTWTAWAITGASDPAEALARFEPLLNTLTATLEPDTARPQTYALGDREFPGYEVTFTTEH